MIRFSSGHILHKVINDKITKSFNIWILLNRKRVLNGIHSSIEAHALLCWHIPFCDAKHRAFWPQPWVGEGLHEEDLGLSR